MRLQQLLGTDHSTNPRLPAKWWYCSYRRQKVLLL